MSPSVSDTERDTDDGKPEGRGGDRKPQETDEKSGRQTDGDDEGGDKKAKGFHPSKKAIVIGVIVVVVLIVAVVLWWLHARQFVTTDDAYTTGHVHQVSARVAGTVTEVRVDDNQRVKPGDVLVRLDPRDNEAALLKARAGLEQARASVVQAEAKVAQTQAQGAAAKAQVGLAQSQVAQASSQLERARNDYERIAGLYSRDIKAVSKADVDAGTSAFNSARSAVEGARANLAAVEAQVEAAGANGQAAEADTQVARASVAASEAEVKSAELQLSYCDVTAAVSGKISKKSVEIGQRLTPGQALMAVVPENIWIVANLKETQLDRLQIGMRVDIKIDSMPGRKFFGSVAGIQEGSGAVFSLLPPDNATGNFTKIVQRVPVKIVFDPESIRDFRDKIVPGLSVEPRIDLESLRDNSREPKRERREAKQNREAEGK